jgi:formylglycine-generating enzyme required for sulfatase activity
MRFRVLVVIAALAASVFGYPAVAGSPSGQLSIDWVSVGDPGNAPDNEVMLSDRTTGYGSVPYRYQIGKYDVTNVQYAGFLNAVASDSDPYLLFDPCMDSAQCYGLGSGIARSGSAGAYTYAVEAGRERRPVNYVNMYDAMRVANWMNNGQGTGDTETGAYTLRGGTPVPTNAFAIRRNAGAKVFLPSENEWYKAAYYDPDKHSYYNYPAGTDTAMKCGLPGPTPNTANCESVTGAANPANPGVPDGGWIYNYLTDVGAYTNSASPFGAFDMGGDVYQWTDDLTYTVTDQYSIGSHITPVLDTLGTIVGSPYTTGVGPCGILRGVDFGDSGEYNASNGRSCDYAVDKFETYGIRLARMPA